MLCLHCKIHEQCPHRGLCFQCYQTPVIRKQYPATNKFGYTSRAGTSGSKMPAPTKALPGSREKYLVLVARAEANEALWHPEDAMHEDDVTIKAA